MKQLFIILAAVVLTATSCSKESVETGDSGAIKFTPTTGAMTSKGTPQYNFGTYSVIDLLVYDETGTRKLVGTPTTLTPTGAVASWQTPSPIGWPIGSSLSFIAYAADKAYAGAGITFTPAAGAPSTISYTAPATAAAQPDLLVANVAAQTLPTDLNVNLPMNHALSCISFTATSPSPRYILSVSLDGVSASGTYTLATSVWGSLSATTAAFAAGVNSNEPVIVTIPDGASNTVQDYLMQADGHLLMVPQTIAAGQTYAVVTYSHYADLSIPVTVACPIAAITWQAGYRYRYTIAFTGADTEPDLTAQVVVWGYQFPEEFDYPYISLPRTIASAAAASVTKLNIEAFPAAALVDLTSTASWLTISDNASGTGAAQSLTGVAANSVYLVMEENTGAARTANISNSTASTGGNQTVKVTQAAP